MGNPITDTIVKTATGIIGKVADKFFPDAAQAEQFKLESAKQLMAMDMAELDMAKSVIIAEAQSTDKWTSRARPSFMYVFYLIILLCPIMGICYAINPVSANNVITGFKAALDSIPDIMWQTFGIGYVGYSASRTVEKHLDGKRANAANKK